MPAPSARDSPLRLVAAAASFSASSLLLTLNSNQLQVTGKPPRTLECLGCRTRWPLACCAADASRQPDLLAGQPCQPTAQGAGPTLTGPPPARAPARPPAHPPEATSCACAARVFMPPSLHGPLPHSGQRAHAAAIQEALLPYFDSPADLLAADKAMHQGDLAKYGEMVTPGTRLAPAVQTDANAPPHVAVWLGRTGGDRAPPSQLDRAHANYTSACSQAQRLR